MKEYEMKRYEPSTDEGSCEFCGYMSEESEGEYVLHSEAQATIARLAAENDLQTAMLLDAYGDSTVLDQIVKQAVDAETRACAEEVDDNDHNISGMAMRARLLARLDQRKEAGE